MGRHRAAARQHLPDRRLGPHRDVFGQVVGIRWRYMSIATNMRRDGDRAQRPAHQEQGDGARPPRRRAHSVAPRRRLRGRFRHAAVARDRASSSRRSRAEIDNVARSRHRSCICTGFGDSGIQYVVVYWIIDLAHDLRTDSQIRLHVYAALARATDGNSPYPHRVLIRANHESRRTASRARRCAPLRDARARAAVRRAHRARADARSRTELVDCLASWTTT